MDRSGEHSSSHAYIERSPIPMFVADETGTCVDVNVAACEMVGYAREELLEMSQTQLSIGDTDLATVFDELDANEQVQLERQLRHKDGHTVDVLVDAVSLPDGEYVAYCQDITERLAYKRRLEESDARYRSMTNALDTSCVGTFILDADFRVVWINESIEAFFGISREAIVGADKAEKIRSEIKYLFEDPDTFAETVIASYEDNSYVESFYCHLLGGESRDDRWLLHWSTPIERGLYAGGRIEHYTDVTESIRYKRRLEEQRDNLTMLNEVMRHDIRNDLQMVTAYADLLTDHVDEAGQAHIQTIIDNAEEAVELTNTARETAEMMFHTDDDYHRIGLRGALESSLEEVRAANPSAVVTAPETIPPVAVRANDMLSSVFRNLLKNAIQHNDKEVPEVVVTATERAETVRICVADNGPGVPDSQRVGLFDKGNKGINSIGTGLGLYLVRTLVESYSGDVWLMETVSGDDTPDIGGAVFVVELPITE